MNTHRAFSILLLVSIGAVFQVSAKDQEGVPVSDGTSAASVATDPPGPDTTPEASAMSPIAGVPFVASTLPVKLEPIPPEEGHGVDWHDLSKAASRFLAIEHGFRLLTEPGTRSGLKGSFFRNYASSVGNLHGWADGDEFYVNYVGHPIQGSVAGFLWVQNDRKYRHSRFGSDRLYWKSRLRAAAFAWCYSTQFEIGPLSEASLGAIQSQFPQQGFVDHAITPAIGMAWMIGEDAVDRYIVERIERATTNRWARLLARSALNPSHTFANFLNGRAPWARDSRAGIMSYGTPVDRRFDAAVPLAAKPVAASPPDTALAPAFEFAVTFQPERFWGDSKGVLCLGGGANAGFRLAPSWQLSTQVEGCKFIGLEKNLSGDSLTYAAGPRWLGRIRGPWDAHVQLLFGGNKITEERLFPELKKVLEVAAIRGNKAPPSHGDYTEETESHGFAVTTGAGLSYALNNVLTIRIAELSYRHSWTGALWGRDYSNSLTLTSGLVLHMGAW